jgi:hypothetical protein
MPAPLPKFEKHTKGYYYLDFTIPKVVEVAPSSNVNYTSWFNYSDYGEHFKEFTWIFNYGLEDLDNGVILLGMSVNLEWDPVGNLPDANAAQTGTIETPTVNSANQTFEDTGNSVIIVPDIDMTGAVGKANIMKCRFKLAFEVANSQIWPAGTDVKIAIQPMHHMV